MSRTEDAILLHESVIHGHHIFKEIWTPQDGEILELQQEPSNYHDAYAVALVKNHSTIVGHVPKENSRTFWYFINRSGRIYCEVTGKRMYGKGLEVPCVYNFFAKEKLIVKLRTILVVICV